jgi:pimeloyl-ACP methyl ester carboxylesterase
MTSALLLAHGAGGTVRANFGPLVPALSRRLPVFGPDFPGSGNTPRATGRLDLDDLADRLVAAAGEVPAFAILGYSMGCAVAVRAAVRYPGRVTGLVLTAGSPRVDRATRARIDEWASLAGGDPAALARFIVRCMFSAAFLDGLTGTQRDILLELAELSVPQGTAEQVDLVRRIDVTGDLAAVAVPTLVIGTRLDRLVTPASMRPYVEGIPGARWVELDSGHAVAMEAPDEWGRLVAGFLAEWSPGVTETRSN